jgi:hypothetical protein
MANLTQMQPIVSTVTCLQSSDTHSQQENEKWNTLLENSEDFLAELADEALAEYLSGKTEPLDLELL